MMHTNALGDTTPGFDDELARRRQSGVERETAGDAPWISPQSCPSSVNGSISGEQAKSSLAAVPSMLTKPLLSRSTRIKGFFIAMAVTLAVMSSTLS